MIRNKIHLFSPGCMRPSIALQVLNRDLKHHSFIHSFIHCMFQRVMSAHGTSLLTVPPTGPSATALMTYVMDITSVQRVKRTAIVWASDRIVSSFFFLFDYKCSNCIANLSTGYPRLSINS